MKMLERLSSIWIALALIAVCPEPSLAQTGLEVLPPIPRPGEVFGIRVTYLTSCPFLRAETEIEGRRIKISAVEGCVCLPGLPQPFVFETYAGLLSTGRYAAQLWVAHEQWGEPCGEPLLVAARDVVVSPSGEPGLLSLAPFPPSTQDRLRLTLRSNCPAQTSYPPPELDGRVLTLVRQYNPAILAPCLSDPVEVGVFDVDPLEAGSYTLRHFTIEVPPAGGGELPAEPDFEAAFEVAEIPLLLLRGERFAVSARWRDSRSGSFGPGRPQALTGDTGSFWFFHPANLEVVVKVLDACPVNGHIWVFAAGLTDLEVEVKVEDRLTGLTRLYRNPPRAPFAPIQDTAAFAVCSP